MSEHFITDIAPSRRLFAGDFTLFRALCVCGWQSADCPDAQFAAMSGRSHVAARNEIEGTHPARDEANTLAALVPIWW